MLNLKGFGNKEFFISFIFTVIFIFLVPSVVFSEEHFYITAFDTPDDSGSSINIKINLTKNENTGMFKIVRHSPDSSPVDILDFSLDNARILERDFSDSNAENWKSYRYELLYSTNPSGQFRSLGITGEVQASPQWFAKSKLPVLLGIILYVVILFVSILLAKRGGIDYIRKLPGLEAIEDAVGRATEMGKPVLYLTGLESISNI
ncbi:MAG: hypothetical protein PHV06_12430, partial [bacterium]|nr:hypothetical protein [bacterium]